MPPVEDARLTTFIVRVTQDGSGRVSGVVERVRDGRKEPLPGDLAGVGAVIERLLPLETPDDAEDHRSSETEDTL